MKKMSLDREMARLIVLQRIELISPFLKRVRKTLGRYVFSNFVAKFFINPSFIGHQYYQLMEEEFQEIKKHINFKGKNILSIGCGMGGLELVISQKYPKNLFDLIEKNYISKKVKYGWDQKNNEAYNKLKLLNYFLINNGMPKKSFSLHDCDKDKLPIKKFDIIISLFSLDYHYDFNIYLDYFKKTSNKKTEIIFDTIRPEYFKDIFRNVKILNFKENTVHKSKRIACSEFI